ncbi:DNA (cytosine-5-)-methyltransferase [Plasmodium inui San Antonio 1]|uniref:DNA (Cytosine-5-)-methyltransferase n=1 Tax=Plasmodium inui San Antonio 1 TaxID=1237626 RepID=W7AV92_9APIC|nr:DNA (cytosine-5-)-methyltransferase [Plasmodium inui San Antonio 1]EUD69336.1 DNA (cytosine-5-)-methyltransferase [Plasmodium inui San Antonio 1]
MKKRNEEFDDYYDVYEENWTNDTFEELEYTQSLEKNIKKKLSKEESKQSIFFCTDDNTKMSNVEEAHLSRSDLNLINELETSKEEKRNIDSEFSRVSERGGPQGNGPGGGVHQSADQMDADNPVNITDDYHSEGQAYDYHSEGQADDRISDKLGESKKTDQELFLFKDIYEELEKRPNNEKDSSYPYDDNFCKENDDSPFLDKFEFTSSNNESDNGEDRSGNLFHMDKSSMEMWDKINSKGAVSYGNGVDCLDGGPYGDYDNGYSANFSNECHISPQRSGALLHSGYSICQDNKGTSPNGNTGHMHHSYSSAGCSIMKSRTGDYGEKFDVQVDSPSSSFFKEQMGISESEGGSKDMGYFKRGSNSSGTSEERNEEDAMGLSNADMPEEINSLYSNRSRKGIGNFSYQSRDSHASAEDVYFGKSIKRSDTSLGNNKGYDISITNRKSNREESLHNSHDYNLSKASSSLSLSKLNDSTKKSRRVVLRSSDNDINADSLGVNSKSSVRSYPSHGESKPEGVNKKGSRSFSARNNRAERTEKTPVRKTSPTNKDNDATSKIMNNNLKLKNGSKKKEGRWKKEEKTPQAGTNLEGFQKRRTSSVHSGKTSNSLASPKKNTLGYSSNELNKRDNSADSTSDSNSIFVKKKRTKGRENATVTCNSNDSTDICVDLNDEESWDDTERANDKKVDAKKKGIVEIIKDRYKKEKMKKKGETEEGATGRKRRSSDKDGKKKDVPINDERLSEQSNSDQLKELGKELNNQINKLEREQDKVKKLEYELIAKSAEIELEREEMKNKMEEEKKMMIKNLEEEKKKWNKEKKRIESEVEKQRSIIMSKRKLTNEVAMFKNKIKELEEKLTTEKRQHKITVEKLRKQIESLKIENEKLKTELKFSDEYRSKLENYQQKTIMKLATNVVQEKMVKNADAKSFPHFSDYSGSCNPVKSTPNRENGTAESESDSLYHPTSSDDKTVHTNALRESDPSVVVASKEVKGKKITLNDLFVHKNDMKTGHSAAKDNASTEKNLKKMKFLLHKNRNAQHRDKVDSAEDSSSHTTNEHSKFFRKYFFDHSSKINDKLSYNSGFTNEEEEKRDPHEQLRRASFLTNYTKQDKRNGRDEMQRDEKKPNEEEPDAGVPLGRVHGDASITVPGERLTNELGIHMKGDYPARMSKNGKETMPNDRGKNGTSNATTTSNTPFRRHGGEGPFSLNTRSGELKRNNTIGRGSNDDKEFAVNNLQLRSRSKISPPSTDLLNPFGKNWDFIKNFNFDELFNSCENVIESIFSSTKKMKYRKAFVDGKVETLFEDGLRIIEKNRNKKIVDPTNLTIYLYPSKDYRAQLPNSYTLFRFVNKGIYQVNIPNKCQLNKFPNGQIDCKYTDGHTQILFCDGRRKEILPNREEYAILINGT